MPTVLLDSQLLRCMDWSLSLPSYSIIVLAAAVLQPGGTFIDCGGDMMFFAQSVVALLEQATSLPGTNHSKRMDYD